MQPEAVCVQVAMAGERVGCRHAQLWRPAAGRPLLSHCAAAVRPCPRLTLPPTPPPPAPCACQGGATVGFQLGGGEDPEASQYGRIRSLVLEELKVGGRLGVRVRAGQAGQAGVARRGASSGCKRTATLGTWWLALLFLLTHPMLRPALPLLQAYFRPELLNRMDEVVVFRQLGRQQVGRKRGRGVDVCCREWQRHISSVAAMLPLPEQHHSAPHPTPPSLTHDPPTLPCAAGAPHC